MWSLKSPLWILICQGVSAGVHSDEGDKPVSIVVFVSVKK